MIFVLKTARKACVIAEHKNLFIRRTYLKYMY